MKKVDKGFELVYWNLSYRRKFLRTLLITPIIVGVILYIIFTDTSIMYKILSSSGLLLLHIILLAYNYKKWKNESHDN